MGEHGLLLNAFIYLAAAVLAVPLAKRLGLGSVLGYLLAGVAIGPWGAGLISDVESILHFAEFGVVLLLFLIGLELNPRRLWSMRRPILGLGGGQVLLTGGLLFGVALLLGLEWRLAVLVAMGLSLSSTAIALQTLQERHLLPTHAGRSAFSVLLFQDIAVIPMLAVIPLLAGSGEPGGGWMDAAKVALVIGGIVVGGYYLTLPVFRIIAATRMREIFTAFSLLLVIGIALLMQAVDLSMALGTFLAGVLLAESEYRHELETEIEPFKGLLLGLFFISVGMSIDFGLLGERPWLVLGLVLGLLTLKGAVLWVLALRFGIADRQQLLFALLLCQGGEFAFVLFSAAAQANLLEGGLKGLLTLAVALSMLSTPLLLLLEPHWRRPEAARAEGGRAEERIEEENPVIIAGFGRFGRVVGRLLHAQRIPTTILDHDPNQIELARQFGYQVYYGEALRMDTLRTAGAEQARLLVIAVDDPEACLEVADRVKRTFPHLIIVARAHDVHHAFELHRRGVAYFQREILESALGMGEQVLRLLGHGAYQAKQRAHVFRARDLKLFWDMYEADALEKRISISREARDELERVLPADEAALSGREESGWS